MAIKCLYNNNILHRDIKPNNIFIKGEKLILGDFGFCRILNSPEELVEKAYGSPMYMAPEALNHNPYGIKSDLYSLGVKFSLKR